MLAGCSCWVATTAFGEVPQWKIDADARIEQHRKGALRIVVRDAAGNPLPGVPLQVSMRRHAFKFGTAIRASIFADARNGETLSVDHQKYLDNTLKYFNTVTFENDLKWRFEDSGSASKISDALDYADKHNIRVRGHTMIWPHDNRAGAVNHDFQLPDGSFSNSDIVDQWQAAGQTDTPAFTSWIQQSVQDRINRIGASSAGRLTHWDVINEPYDDDSSGGDIWLERRWSGDGIDLIDPASGDYRPSDTGVLQLADIRAEWIRLASIADPHADLFVNNFNLVTWNPGSATVRGTRLSTLKNMIDALNDPDRVNAPGALDGIGMQAHYASHVRTPEYTWDRLEQLGELDRDLKLSITEYDYVPYPELTETNEAEQLEYVLTELFSHPQADAFIMWGIFDPMHYRNNTPMFDANWNLKLPGQKYVDLVFNEWWTDESVSTDGNGECALNAFHGEYLLTATRNGARYRQIIQLDPANTNETLVSITASGPPLLPLVSLNIDAASGRFDVTFVSDIGTNYTVYAGTNLSQRSLWNSFTNLTGDGSDLSIEHQPEGFPPTYFVEIRED